ncbi:MAG: aminotransferase class IV [Chitinophagales bacterium]
MLQVSLNGKIISASKARFATDNRAFRFGDSIFETCRYHNAQVPLLDLHLQRMFTCMQYIGMEIPAHWNVSWILSCIQDIADAHAFSFCRVRLTASRQGGGSYTPERNTPDLLIEVSALPTEKFDTAVITCMLGEYHDMQKSTHPVFRCKTGNALLYVLAAKFARENGYDDVLIFNEKEEITDAISSNVWVVKNSVLYTTPDDGGAVLGVMRRYLLENAAALEVEVGQIALDPEILLSADEVFLSNAIHGIRSVSTYQDRTYLNNKGAALLEKLNTQLF